MVQIISLHTPTMLRAKQHMLCQKCALAIRIFIQAGSIAVLKTARLKGEGFYPIYRQ